MISEYIYIPYFYIIRHKITKIMYAGSRWVAGCNPKEFMKIGGYTTSSTIINGIIEQEGLDSFEIIRIDTNCDGLHPRDYETLFLQTLDCANSHNWYNGHNNVGISFGTKEFASSMIAKYGKEHSMLVPSCVDKQKKSYVKSCLKNYGVDNLMKVNEICAKANHYRELTSIKKYGVKSVFELPDIQLKANIASKNTMMKRHGVTNPSQLQFLCIIETKKTYAKNKISQSFPEFKQYY